ncbi:MAG: dienelactone hydrolase family protein, partial [Burkholderiales bacterium]|nr:dienelactone hydrolase family protein [Burkholderiales bacterium]
VSWVSAAQAKGLACAVPYYGGGMPGFINEKPKVPTMCHFGELDQSPTLAQAKEIAARHPGITAHFYAGAGHGFNCDQRGSWNAEAAQLARGRTVEFFRRHLG